MGLDLLIRNGTVVDGSGMPRYRADVGSRDCRPWRRDLPGGARRLVQKADGIAAIIVNGAVALENGEATDNFAGVVLKGSLASA